MILINPITTGEVATFDEGSLIAYPRHGRAASYAVLVKKFDEACLLAVLRAGDDNTAPHSLHIHGGNDCISYGSDWAFEIVPPIPGESFVEDAGHLPGSVSIAGSSASLRLNGDPNNAMGSNRFYLDLATLKPCSTPPHNAVVVRKWRIWHRSTDVAIPGASPLFVFGD